ncbi:hypothetical protein CKM354_000241400 [Cercospora kikuchii]|uniref:Uncharacterized protein n=1 Tax=Cercospora kikuchii TaxID=84275 RepID=A0A9P3CCU5_9PEZI|nr:uncharacterized protein CKM354_000241400 [Cercospora kikuchii]GIZ39022.1 hypothetical protein CKM354_000241400 [Cercospora kikuchii]
MDSPTRTTPKPPLRLRSSPRKWRINKISTAFSASNSSLLRTPLSPWFVRTPRRKRISASWLGNAAWEPEWEYGHLRFHEEQERWEREGREEEESRGWQTFNGVLSILINLLIYEAAGWVWFWVVMVPLLLTGWAGYEYVAWVWERWVEGIGGGEEEGGSAGRVVYMLVAKVVEICSVLAGLLDLIPRLGLLVSWQLWDSSPGLLLRKVLHVLDLRATLVGRAAHAASRSLGASSAVSEHLDENQQEFSPMRSSAEQRMALYTASPVDSMDPGKDLGRVMRQSGQIMDRIDVKAGRIRDSPISGIPPLDRWLINVLRDDLQEDEVRAGANIETQLEAIDSRHDASESSSLDDMNWKPYWSRSLEKPVHIRQDVEVTEGTELPNTPNSLASPVAATPRTPADEARSPLTSIREETAAVSRPLGNIAMLQRWLTKVSDLSQACDILWHSHHKEMIDPAQCDTALQQVEQECELVHHLDVRIAWDALDKGKYESSETDLLVGVQQLKDVRERKTLAFLDDEILYDAHRLMKALLGRVQTLDHQGTKGKRKSRPSNIVSDGWSLNQVQLVQKEVRQLAQSRLQILDSVYLLGRAYSKDKVVAEYGKLQSQLWPLAAQAKVLGLGSRNEQLQRAVADVEKTVHTEIAALKSDLERADYTRSLNEYAGQNARDMLQDSKMTGLTPTTPKVAFGHAVAKDDEIAVLKNYIWESATQLDKIVFLESAARIRNAEQIETDIREHLSKLSSVVDYSDEHARLQIDHVFEIADALLLELRNIKTAPAYSPVDPEVLPDRTPTNVNFGPLRQRSEPPTPVQVVPAKEFRTEQPSDYPAKRALWQRQYTESFDTHQADRNLPLPFPAEFSTDDNLELKTLQDGLQGAVKDLESWRTSYERLTSVYDKKGCINDRHATHTSHPSLRGARVSTAGARSTVRVWPSPSDLVAVQDGQIGHEVLVSPLTKLNDIRTSIESILLLLNLERKRSEQARPEVQSVAQYTDLERTANQALDYVLQCLLDLGERSSELDQTKVTFEQAQLYASVACWVGLKQGSFVGRYNTLAQLEDAQTAIEDKFDAINKKACGEAVPTGLRSMALILDQLEYHRTGTDRLAEVCTADLDVEGIRKIRERTKKLQNGLRDVYAWMRERHNQRWFLDGPSDAISDLYGLVQAGKNPSATDDQNHLCGARALLSSLQTCLKAQDSLMFDGRIPGPEDAEEMLRKMFVESDDMLALRPVPTKSPENLMEPTSEYAAFLFGRFSAIELEHGLGSEIYRQYWDEARAFNDWTPRQMKIVFDFIAQGHVFQLPAIDLRLGVVTRDVGDSRNSTTATVELFEEEAVSNTSAIVWVYYDNASNLVPGVVPDCLDLLELCVRREGLPWSRHLLLVEEQVEEIGVGLLDEVGVMLSQTMVEILVRHMEAEVMVPYAAGAAIVEDVAGLYRREATKLRLGHHLHVRAAHEILRLLRMKVIEGAAAVQEDELKPGIVEHVLIVVEREARKSLSEIPRAKQKWFVDNRNEQV